MRHPQLLWAARASALQSKERPFTKEQEWSGRKQIQISGDKVQIQKLSALIFEVSRDGAGAHALLSISNAL